MLPAVTVRCAGIQVISRAEWGPDLGLVPRGSWNEIVGPQRGAVHRSLYSVTLAAGTRSARLNHPSEAVYFVEAGAVTLVELVGAGARRYHMTTGRMVHLSGGSAYYFESTTGAHLLGGPSPVDPTLGAGATSTRAELPTARLFSRDTPGVRVPSISRDARLIVWLGVGAMTANMDYVVLEPGERHREHVHAVSEDTIYILEGHGTAENITTGERLPFGPGDTVHIDPGFWHAVAADRGERVVSVGGPCPADVNTLRAAGVESLANHYREVAHRT